MAKKPIKEVMIRWYAGEENKVKAIEGIESSVILNEFLKNLIQKALTGKPEANANQATTFDTETLAKELLPQIRKVIEAVLAEHTISTNSEESQVDEDAQQRIQDGLKKLGQSMM